MIKVCHMTSAHDPEDVRIFHKECVSLAKAGYEVYLVERGESYEKNGVHIIGAGQPDRGRLSRMTGFAKKVYEAALAVDADIYHVHDPELLPWGLKLKKKGKKVVFDSHEDTVHQIFEKQWIPPFLQNPVSILYACYQTNICKKLDLVITVSPHICEYLQSCGLKVSMISNFPFYGEALASHGSQRGKISKLVFAGGIDSQWHHEKIITAVERYPDLQYVLLGDGPDSYIKQLKALPGWTQVDFRGKIPYEEVFQVLSSCDIGMALLGYTPDAGYHRGTLGNTKIFEEMMAGLPVVCTDFVLWREFVDRWHCGVCVDPDNAEEVANAIRYLLDHPEEARQMGENGRRAVREEFNWGVEEKKLLAFYRELCAA